MKVEIEKAGEFSGLRAYFDAFPELSARIFGYFGKQAALQLFEDYSQGKDISVTAVARNSVGAPRGELGRRLVTCSTGRGLKWIAVSSFPYENRKQLRGKDAERSGILRRESAAGLSGRLNAYITQMERLNVDDWFINREKEKTEGMGGAISKL